jgi:hypothetical protein
MKTLWALRILCLALFAGLLPACDDSDDDPPLPPFPTAPTQLFALRSNEATPRVMLFGTGDPNATSYKLYSSSDGVTYAVESASLYLDYANPDLTPYLFLFTTNNTSTDLYYRVTSVNAAGESGASPVVFAKIVSDYTLDVFTPTAPADGAVGVSTLPTLSWPAQGGATAYYVYLQYGAIESWDCIVQSTTYDLGSTLNLIVGKYLPALPAISPITLHVTAIDADGWGNQRSTVISFTTGT